MERWEARLLDEYINRHFTPTQVDSLMEKPLTGPEGLRRQLSELDMEYFARAYFPDRLFRDMPTFHSQGYKDLQIIADNPGGHKRAEAAPRGYSKSTRSTLIFPLYNVLYKKKKYIFLISDTSSQSSEFLTDIQGELEGNNRILEDFGSIVGNPWNSTECVTKTGIKLECAGSGQKIRGRRHGAFRPDLILLDDLENDENTATQEQRLKLKNWFTKVVLKLGDSYTDFVYVGTIIHYDSLFMWALKNPVWKPTISRAVMSFSEAYELWDEWESIVVDLSRPNRINDALDFYKNHEDEMSIGTEVLWPEKQSYYDLMLVKITEGEASFNSELQNEPINPEDRLFKCQYYDLLPPLDELYIVGAVDPSMGKTSRADYTAILTLGKHLSTGFIYVLDAIIKRMHPDRIIETIFEQHKRWNYKEFAVETVQFQQFFKDEVAKRAAERGIYLNIREVKTISNKELRIQSIQPTVNNGYVKLDRSQSLLVEQLENWPKAAHDDGPDTLEMGLSLVMKMSVMPIFAAWSDEKNIFDDDMLPAEFKWMCSRSIAVSHGTATPMVFLDIYDDGRTLWVMKEYYWDPHEKGIQKADHEYAEDIEEFIGKDPPDDIILHAEAASFKAELRQRGFRVRDAFDEVNDGLRMTSAMISRRLIKVHASCVYTQKEIKGYVWDEKASERGEEKPLSIKDNCPNALRYYVKTKIKPWRLVS